MSVQKRALFLLLLLAVLLAAAGLWIHSRTPSSGTPYALITQDGMLLYEINLDTVETPYFLQITDEAGADNQIEVSHGQIRMSQASCPDQICIHTGWIETDALPIVCLPNRIVIEIFYSKEVSP